MVQDYRVEKLVETFKEHAKMSEHSLAETRKSFIENFPDSPVPDHLTGEGFNIAHAFSSICAEIQEIKKELDLK